jgi:hypothetical protein
MPSGVIGDLRGDDLARFQHGADIGAVPRCPPKRGLGVGRILNRGHEPFQLRRIEPVNRGRVNHVLFRHHVRERIGARRYGVNRIVAFMPDHRKNTVELSWVPERPVILLAAGPWDGDRVRSQGFEPQHGRGTVAIAGVHAGIDGEHGDIHHTVRQHRILPPVQLGSVGQIIEIERVGAPYHHAFSAVVLAHPLRDPVKRGFGDIGGFGEVAAIANCPAALHPESEREDHDARNSHSSGRALQYPRRCEHRQYAKRHVHRNLVPVRLRNYVNLSKRAQNYDSRHRPCEKRKEPEV